MSYERPSFWSWRSNTNHQQIPKKSHVGCGSPANGILQRGDIITKVGNYDARDIRHQDAQTLFKNAGNNVRVVVQREVAPRSATSSRNSSHAYSPLSVSPHLSPRQAGGNYSSPMSPGYSPAGSALTPYYSAPMTPIDDNYFDPVYYATGDKGSKNVDPSQQDVHVTKQPYRTTPLILPGAKVKHEPDLTESYLRHHPNPQFRLSPHQLDHDHYLKQKVTNTVLERLSTGDPNKQIVHKQFNSPINLYSDTNVVETLQKQTGITPVRKQVKFNPAESETYKAIQEEDLGDHVQEITVPPQSRVYTPNKCIPKPHSKSFSDEMEEPRQSGSFKRLMLSVMPETSY